MSSEAKRAWLGYGRPLLVVGLLVAFAAPLSGVVAMGPEAGGAFGFQSSIESSTDPAPLRAEEGGNVVLILKDGVKISGELISETDESVKIRTSYAELTVAKSKIREIVRGAENPFRGRWEERFRAASKKRDVAELRRVAKFAKSNQLAKEWRQTLEKIVEIEPEDLEARTALGHAQLDGKWIGTARVEQLLEKGYTLQGRQLIPPASGGQNGGQSGGTTVVGRKELPPEQEELTPEERREREKARKKADQYRKRKLDEYNGGVDWDDRHVELTKHYRLESNVPREVLKVYKWLVEKFYALLSKRLTGGDVLPDRSTIRLFKNRAEYAERYGASGGHYNPQRTINAYHGTFGATGSTLGVLGHEMTHEFQHRKLGAAMWRMPRWLLEGMAVYFGDGTRLDYKKKNMILGLVPRDRLLHLQRKMEAGTNESLDSILNLNDRRPPNGSQYADCWAVIHYLFEGPEKTKGRRLLGEYWLLGKKNGRANKKDFTELAEKHFGSVKELEEQIFAYVRKLEADPIGEWDENTYSSRELKFSIDRPAERWKVEPDADNSATVLTLVLPEQHAKIRLQIWPRDDLNVEDEDFIRTVYSNKLYTDQFEGFDFTSHEFVPGDAVVVTYREKPKKKDDDDEDDDDKEPKPIDKGGKKPADEKPRMKRRDYAVVWVDKAFVVRCEAPIDTFASFESEFLRCAKSLRIRVENRW